MKLDTFSISIITHEKSRHFSMSDLHANRLYSVLMMRGNSVHVEWQNRHSAEGSQPAEAKEVLVFCVASIVETVCDYWHKVRKRRGVTAALTRAALFSIYGNLKRLTRMATSSSLEERLAIVRQKNIRWSHMQCLKRGIESNRSYIVIVEDDFRIESPDMFWKALDEIASNGLDGCYSLSGSWEGLDRCYQIGQRRLQGMDKTESIFGEYVERGVDSCCATVYSKNVARRLYGKLIMRDRCLMAIDWEITRELRSRELRFAKCYRARRSVIGSESSML